MERPQTLEGAVLQFLAQLAPESRREAQQALNRFLLWAGRERPIGAFPAREIQRYEEQEQRRGGDLSLRLEPLRAFLQYAAKQRLTEADLSKALRQRRDLAAPKPAPVAPAHLPASQQLTLDGLELLRAELEQKRAERPALAEGLRRARADGDVTDNAPLEALRDYQGQLEARIRELEGLLARATVLASRGPSSYIGLGSTVLLRDLDTGEGLLCTLVEPAEANPGQGKLSRASPLGRALMGRTAGEEVTVAAPAGVLRYRVEAPQD